ncbi:MAG: hypothetical protein LKK00_05780 [Intestinimonas sp.]|jgi:hypothetical protein|nr:hypothetical protein [Intestinimonas sp.]
MTALEHIRKLMTELLMAAGLDAVTAWPESRRTRHIGATAAVSIRACESGPGSFCDYLGEQYDTKSETWRELYGKKMKITFGLDLYAPREGGAATCQSAFDRLAGALQSGGPSGLSVLSLTQGETAFDRDTELYHCPVTAVCQACLYATAEEGGAFLDFEVKGAKI